MKLRDMTKEQYALWCEKYCKIGIMWCRNCPFASGNCDWRSSKCWVNHKEMFSDKFLDQEIEIKEEK